MLIEENYEWKASRLYFFLRLYKETRYLELLTHDVISSLDSIKTRVKSMIASHDMKKRSKKAHHVGCLLTA